MKKNTFSMLDENGNEVVYDVLFTFETEDHPLEIRMIKNMILNLLT